MDDRELLKHMSTISMWVRIFALCSMLLVGLVVALWLDLRSATVRVRWIERKMDQGKMFVVDERTLREWESASDAR